MKMNRNFNTFTDLESLELEVPKICLVIGCVLARRADVTRSSSSNAS